MPGAALIRPDLPELKVWPYFWQQRIHDLARMSALFPLGYRTSLAGKPRRQIRSSASAPFHSFRIPPP